MNAREMVRARGLGWRVSGEVGETIERPGVIVWLERFNTESRVMEWSLAWVPENELEPVRFDVSINVRGVLVDSELVRID